MRVTVLLLLLELAGLAVVEEGVTTVRVTVLDGRVPVVLFVAGLLMVFVFVREVVTVLEVAGRVVVVVVGLVGVMSVLAVVPLMGAGLVVPVFSGWAEIPDGFVELLTSVRAPVTVLPKGVALVEVVLLLLLLLKELPAPVVPATRLS